MNLIIARGLLISFLGKRAVVRSSAFNKVQLLILFYSSSEKAPSMYKERNAFTTTGSNCAPAHFSISSSIKSRGSFFR